MTRTATVVIATDNPTAIADALALAGHTVAARCSTLAETLAAVRRDRPDVCVVDRAMPDAGLAAIAALAGTGRRPRVIVVGSASPQETRAARLAGATACVPTVNAVAAAVTAALRP
jgi:CheY-like chemotaxis protein